MAPDLCGIHTYAENMKTTKKHVLYVQQTTVKNTAEPCAVDRTADGADKTRAGFFNTDMYLWGLFFLQYCARFAITRAKKWRMVRQEDCSVWSAAVVRHDGQQQCKNSRSPRRENGYMLTPLAKSGCFPRLSLVVGSSAAKETRLPFLGPYVENKKMCVEAPRLRAVRTYIRSLQPRATRENPQTGFVSTTAVAIKCSVIYPKRQKMRPAA